jgi:hypothetical protein
MSKMERIDSRSATSAPDDLTTPAIARAAKQPSAPAVRDEAPEVLPKRDRRGARIRRRRSRLPVRISRLKTPAAARERAPAHGAGD